MTQSTRTPDLGPWKRITLNPEMQVALWVQLKTQLQYLISTGEIPAGTKLPPVRAFANHLGIAVDTVRKAYDEAQRNDLVRTIHGVGTFTSLPSEPSSTLEAREDRWERMDRALFAMARDGIDLAAEARILRQRLAVCQTGVHAVFFGVTPSASRYARQISNLLPEGLEVRSADIEDLRQGRFDVAGVTHAVALPLHRREIETILTDWPVRCLTLVSKLAPGLTDRIPAAVDARKILLVARPETAQIYTNILASVRPDLVEPVFVLDTDETSLRGHVGDADIVLHTTVATAMVQRVTGRTKTLIELQHLPEAASLRSVAELLIKDHQLQQELLHTSAYRELV
ncbi:GntR family transcriptional regulator [Arthrobacter sp. ISL-95]|uniref:GntR family transcriptional regulator n=1 Tax=Arthrobacter sp. ISL-95 TaxID=2819116 RepID=UPI001BE5CE3C|nr:GntR family transcriptional regulator [Arthrobacter sp. ISL-95]MBT2588359.1 GntR family transcriptional regulator [Arthrobacter sp. ISL-95]